MARAVQVGITFGVFVFFERALIRRFPQRRALAPIVAGAVPALVGDAVGRAL